jgi:two-component system cell cycle sensor histidine kinase/response regulator CckA
MNDKEKSRDELLAEIRSLRMENSRLNKKIFDLTPKGNQALKKTILIVDDNEEARQSVVAMVKKFGYTAIEADSPHRALALFTNQNASIDLILSDIVMPDGGGPAMVDKIRKLNPDINVIFMSGYAEDEVVHDQVFEIQKSCTQFIKKPFTMEEIRSLLQQQLEKKTVNKGDVC